MRGQAGLCYRPDPMDLRPLRHNRDFRALFAAQFVSFLGSMVTYVALPYQMYKLTHSSLAVGLLGLAELLPLLVTAFVGGALADTVDRRRMVLFTESVISGGVLCVLGVLLCGALLPRFVAYDARTYNAASAATAAKEEVEHEEKAV